MATVLFLFLLLSKVVSYLLCMLLGTVRLKYTTTILIFSISFSKVSELPGLHETAITQNKLLIGDEKCFKQFAAFNHKYFVRNDIDLAERSRKSCS